MRTILFLALFGIMLASVSYAAHTITQTFSGECPPDDQFEVRCWDLRGVVYVSTTVGSGETHSYNIPNSVETLVCIVECNGEEVYRKRYEFPGTRWKAVPGYPYDIARNGGLPAGTDINDTINVGVRSCDDCGNGKIDSGENCDGSRGCTDPLKPACYDCTYCGCNDAKQCVQISGAMQCGTYGCAAYERPKFTAECLEGICSYPRKCVMDPECIDKYQAERDKKVESIKQGYHISSGFVGAQSRAFVGERYQGKSPQVPVDDFGGTIAAVLASDGTESYKVNGIPYEVEIGEVSDTASFIVNGNEHELGAGESAVLDGQAMLEVNAIESGSVYFYISTITTDDLRIMLFTGDYNGDSGEITWPPKGKGDNWYPPTTVEGTIPAPFGLQPGEKAHMVCTSNLVCAAVRGEGLDECGYEPGPSEQCRKINETGKHNECQYGQCVVVPGNGTDQCMKDEDCKKPVAPAGGTPGDGTTPGSLPEDADGRHGACSAAGYCIYAEGEGPDQCRGDGDCSEVQPTDSYSDNRHTVCKDKRCIYVYGEGADECAGHWQCDSGYPLPATKQMKCFGNVCRMETGDFPSGGGRICRTNMDCGGKALFSSLMGGEIHKDAMIGPPLNYMIGNERVNFYAGNETAYVLLQNGKVVDAGDGQAEDNTVNVRTDLRTIEEIEAGNLTPLEAFRQDRIIIEGEGFGNWLKFAMMNLFFDLGLISVID